MLLSIFQQPGRIEESIQAQFVEVLILFEYQIFNTAKKFNTNKNFEKKTSKFEQKLS